MEVLTFNVDKDRRNLTSDVQNFDIDFKNSPSWVQARQYENQMRQVQVNVQHGDGTPFDLTGANPVLEGFMPDGVHRIIDAKHGVMIDPVNGQFRFDFPAPVFAVSGSYKQIFFRLYRAGKNIATLEFSMEVLADKVISGLIPADYVTPIEDIMDKAETVFNNATGDIDAIKAAWAAKLQNLFDSLSKTGKDTADALMQVQAGLTTLETQIKSDGLMTAKDLENSIKPIQDWFNQSKADLTDNKWLGLTNQKYFEIDGGIKPYFANALGTFRSSLKTNLFTIAYGTDYHYDVTSVSSPYYADGLRHALNMLSLGDISNATIFGGDQCDTGTLRKDYLIKQETDFATTVFSSREKNDLFLLKGNHDSGYHLEDDDYKIDNVIRDSDFSYIYEQDNYFGENRNQNSNYFYKDYVDQKIRIIGLDSYDLPESVDGEGKPIFNRFTTSGYSNAQLEWLANVALKTPSSDYAVIIFAHNPLNHVFGNYDSSAYLNSECLQNILEGYVHGVSTTIVGTDDSLPVSVKTAFAEKGNLIGFVSGHIHKDAQKTLNGVNYVSTVCSATGLDKDDTSLRISEYGTAKEDAFDVIQIDTSNRTAYFNRFGSGVSRQLTY